MVIANSGPEGRSQVAATQGPLVVGGLAAALKHDRPGARGQIAT